MVHQEDAGVTTDLQLFSTFFKGKVKLFCPEKEGSINTNCNSVVSLEVIPNNEEVCCKEATEKAAGTLKRLRHWMPSSPQSLLLKSAFRHPGALRGPENPKLTLVGGISGSGQVTFKQTAYGQGSDGMHPRELRKLTLAVAKSFLVFFESSWQWGAVPEDWKCHPYLQKGKTENLGNHRLFRLSLIREFNVKRNF